MWKSYVKILQGIVSFGIYSDIRTQQGLIHCLFTMIYVWPESKEQNQKYLKGTSDLSVLFVQTNLKLERHGTRVAKEREESKLCKAELRNSHLCRWHPPACPASTDRHSLCHCNWHGNHNDDRSPWGGGAWTWEISFTNTR